MVDVHTPAVRSKNMRAIRSANTKPEIVLRKALYASGFRYRLKKNGLPCKPDVILNKYRTVIFMHGCFWHGHDCKYFRPPKSRSEFWSSKISQNRERDLRTTSRLIEDGWKVIVVWECALRSSGIGVQEVIRQISELLLNGEGLQYLEIPFVKAVL